MKNILIPTDFSENSRNAIEYATRYFKNVQANFYLIHVAPKLDNESTNNKAKIASETNFYITNFSNSHHHFFEIYVEVSLIEGIRKAILSKKIDYIFMGTKGGSTTNSSEIGSNTSEVITKIKCPTFVIPKIAKFAPIKNVAFPTDYNCSFKYNVRHTLANTLLCHKATVHVLNVKCGNQKLSTNQLENKSFLKDILYENEHNFHTLESRTIENGIQSFSEMHQIDLIAMVAKNLNLIQRLLFNSKNSTPNYRIQLPFLVIHE